MEHGQQLLYPIGNGAQSTIAVLKQKNLQVIILPYFMGISHPDPIFSNCLHMDFLER